MDTLYVGSYSDNYLRTARQIARKSVETQILLSLRRLSPKRSRGKIADLCPQT